MPLLLLVLALLGFLVLFTVAIPFGIIGRYRAGTMRRRARPWLAAVNSVSIGISVLLFMVTALIANTWIHGALGYSAVGLGGGLVLGLLGLRLTQWQTITNVLYYTPNRWLVLAITLGVSLRLAFGLWRVWEAWHGSSNGHSWLAESGVAGSMATGAVVLGYYLTYWLGIWWRTRKPAHVIIDV